MTILLVLAFFSVGCGSDDESSQDAPRGRSENTQTPGTTASETEDEEGTATSEETQTEAEPSEEEQVEGGPGDEVPAEVPAMLEVRRGSLVPSSVRVPPFIGVVVEVRAASGTHEVRVGRRVRTASPGRPARFRLAGLRSEESVTVRLADGGTARIVASAEPGP